MKIALVLLGLAILIGLAFGIARDLYSFERATLTGKVISAAPGGGHKAPMQMPPSLKVELYDGRIVDVATKGGLLPGSGATIEIVEMQTPWGQIWYKAKERP